ncbi:HpcH/HpaI aldolase/citrate lyase family protein [Marinimicrococcus flavescens]|uniref:CoA ester lyase n=1 Tax=Marinimicrococcus flavescens TaxID=3031815 RepID=A0AAP3UXP5_9PROT|nr:CoA ester lyase [Marinimicrococcus flavescens]
MSPVRPRRSALYMPGSNPRALEKGRTLPADALILDLEDAVAADAKATGRDTIRAALAGREAYGRRELVVRVNGLDTPWGHADLQAMAGAGADAVLLPKVESADMVRRAASVLDGAGAPPELALWCMMETPRGILRAEEIADHPRVACLVMGTSDLTKDLTALHTAQRLPMMVSLGTCLLAARAAGISILDGVHLDLGDTEGLEASCRQGRELGFDGKTLIHPKQLDAANAVFGPSEEEIAQARQIILAFEAAQAEGKGVVLLDGRLVENLHVAEAQRLVALSETIAAMQA